MIYKVFLWFMFIFTYVVAGLVIFVGSKFDSGVVFGYLIGVVAGVIGGRIYVDIKNEN